jgi:hypothetical protein
VPVYEGANHGGTVGVLEPPEVIPLPPSVKDFVDEGSVTVEPAVTFTELLNCAHPV